jgi:hypothetical protein
LHTCWFFLQSRLLEDSTGVYAAAIPIDNKANELVGYKNCFINQPLAASS